jgi:hypothetical protein
MGEGWGFRVFSGFGARAWGWGCIDHLLYPRVLHVFVCSRSKVVDEFTFLTTDYTI